MPLSLVLLHADIETMGHCARVGQLVFQVLKERPHLVTLSDNERADLTCGAFFHDFGKLFLKQEILKKRTALPTGQIRTILTRIRGAASSLGLDWKKMALDVVRLNQGRMSQGRKKRVCQMLDMRDERTGRPILSAWEVSRLCRSGLSQSEYRHVQKHTVLGYEFFVKIVEFASPIFLDVVRHHHEKADQSGYPDQIPAPRHVQLVGVIDSYDALISPRSYKAALHPHVAAKILRGYTPRLFATDIVEAVIQAVQEDNTTCFKS